jgi:transposase
MRVKEVIPTGAQDWKIVHPNAAGIDVGAAEHYVAVPAGRDAQPVRRFGACTQDLIALVEWLKGCGIDTVAMESTGVYWIPLYELLEAGGFAVILANARSVKNVPGRKSDVLDCQWLAQLTAYGLVSSAFRPAGEVCALRELVRQRQMLISMQAQHIQHMQKALALMNLKLTEAVSDITGKTGLSIIRAIVAGERDAERLARLRDRRVKASEAEVRRALQGHYRAEHLFALKQALHLYDAYAERVQECDVELERVLTALARVDDEVPPPDPKKAKSHVKNAPAFDLRKALFRCYGVDLTRINGIHVTTALTVLAEIGFDLTQFKSAKHFCAWLGLAPGTRISGGKRLGGRRPKVANRAAQALRLAAQSLRNSQSALGAYFRRQCARMDKPKAITATAHKFARIIYAMLTKGQAFVDQGQALFEERHRQRVLHNLKRRAMQLGMNLVPVQQPQISHA